MKLRHCDPCWWWQWSYFNTAQMNWVAMINIFFITIGTSAITKVSITRFNVETIFQACWSALINYIGAISWSIHIFTCFANIICLMKGSTDQNRSRPKTSDQSRAKKIENRGPIQSMDPCSYQDLHSHSTHLLFQFYSRDLKYRILLECIEAFVLLVLELILRRSNHRLQCPQAIWNKLIDRFLARSDLVDGNAPNNNLHDLHNNLNQG